MSDIKKLLLDSVQLAAETLRDSNRAATPQRLTAPSTNKIPLPDKTVKGNGQFSRS